MQSGTKCGLCQLNEKLLPKRRPPPSNLLSSSFQSLYNSANQPSTTWLQILHTGLFVELASMESHVDVLCKFNGRSNDFLFLPVIFRKNAEIQSTSSQFQLNYELKHDYESAEDKLVLFTVDTGLRPSEESVPLKLKRSCLLHKSQCSKPTPSEHLCTPVNSYLHGGLLLLLHSHL
jgi:hypothetical protein